MIAYFRPKQELQDIERPEPRPSALSRELFHGLTPEQFDVEAKSLAKAQAMTPSVRARLKSQLVERLKTPVDDIDIATTLTPDAVTKTIATLPAAVQVLHARDSILRSAMGVGS